MPMSSRSDVRIASCVPSADQESCVGSPFILSSVATFAGVATWTARASAAVLINMASLSLDLREFGSQLRRIRQRRESGASRLCGERRLGHTEVGLDERQVRRQQLRI